MKLRGVGKCREGFNGLGVLILVINIANMISAGLFFTEVYLCTMRGRGVWWVACPVYLYSSYICHEQSPVTLHLASADANEQGKFYRPGSFLFKGGAHLQTANGVIFA